MKRAVFLDRDGTVIALGSDDGRLSDIKDMRLLPSAAEALCILNKAGFLIFIHTNQTVVAWGQISETMLQHMHDVLSERLRKKGARVEGIYYCPHHPEAPLQKYRKVCRCRKPKAGMIQEAIKEYGVNVSQSYMVGDSSKDILMGERAGLRTILVRTGNAGKEYGAVPVKPDYIAKNILAAARYIRKRAAKPRV